MRNGESIGWGLSRCGRLMIGSRLIGNCGATASTGSHATSTRSTSTTQNPEETNMTSQVNDKYGVLEPAGTRWRLRYMRHLKHAPDKVWRALTEPEHLQAWFPQKIVGGWAVGATLKFVSDNGDFEGKVPAYQPPPLAAFLVRPPPLPLSTP